MSFSAITLFSAKVFYFLFLISIFVSPLSGLIVIIIFGVVQLIALRICNMYVADQMKHTVPLDRATNISQIGV